jgi:hypothetical protein
MLNQNKVLNYIKTNLGFPYQFIEMEDSAILDYISKYTISEYSHFFPHTNTIGYNLKSPVNLVPDKANEYYIQDPDGLEIIDIKSIIFRMSQLTMFGHPPLGPLSLGELPSWTLAVETAGWIKTYSNWNYTYEFKHPNVIRISPTPVSEDICVIEYERVHDPSFSTITADLAHMFMDFCLADIMILLGRIRSKYSEGGGLATPFGNVPLQGSQLYDEGREKKKELLDKFEQGSLPSLSWHFG